MKKQEMRLHHQGLLHDDGHIGDNPLIMKLHRNEQGKDYFIGDIHGCYDQLMDKLNEKNFDFTKDRLISVGDLVDRGPDSIKCLELINEPWFFAVRGNHEQLLVEYIMGQISQYVYLNNGGVWFIELDHETRDRLKALVDSMPYIIEVETSVGKIGVIHGDAMAEGWSDYYELSEYDYRALEQLVWGRTRISYRLDTPVNGIDYVVVGHTTVRYVVTMGNVVYIDTGLVYDAEGGYVTIVTPEEIKAHACKVV